VQRHIRDVPIAVDKLLWVIPRALLDELVRLKLFVIEICDFNATLVPAELANTSEPNPEQRETLWARVPAHIAARMSAFAASRGETVSALIATAINKYIATAINKYHADRLTESVQVRCPKVDRQGPRRRVPVFALWSEACRSPAQFRMRSEPER